MFNHLLLHHFVQEVKEIWYLIIALPGMDLDTKFHSHLVHNGAMVINSRLVFDQYYFGEKCPYSYFRSHIDDILVFIIFIYSGDISK